MIFKAFTMLLLISNLCAFGQEMITKDTIISRLREIRNEIVKIDPSSEQIRNQLNNSRDKINDAITNVALFADEFPPLYDKNLRVIIEIVRGIEFEDPHFQNQLLDQLTNDIQLKFGSNSKSLENTISTDLIKVLVTTKKNGENINGLRVKYSLLGFKVDYNNPNYVFNRLSSPTNDQLLPGVYKFWITKDGDTTVLKSLIVRITREKEDNSVEFNVN